MYTGVNIKYPLFFSDCKETWISSVDIRKNTQVLNFMKILPLGPELFHADGQTERHMTKLLVAFRYFTNTPKNGVFFKKLDSYDARFLTRTLSPTQRERSSWNCGRLQHDPFKCVNLFTNERWTKEHGESQSHCILQSWIRLCCKEVFTKKLHYEFHLSTHILEYTCG